MAGGRYHASDVDEDDDHPWKLKSKEAMAFTMDEVLAYDAHMFNVQGKLTKTMHVHQLAALQVRLLQRGKGCVRGGACFGQEGGLGEKCGGSLLISLKSQHLPSIPLPPLYTDGRNAELMGSIDTIDSNFVFPLPRTTPTQSNHGRLRTRALRMPASHCTRFLRPAQAFSSRDTALFCHLSMPPTRHSCAVLR